MIAVAKGLVPGTILTWVVSSAIGATRSTGGMLHIFHVPIAQHEIFWSWPLFTASVALAAAIFVLLD